MKKNKKMDDDGLFRLIRKGLLIMRLFLIFMLLGILQSTATVYSQNKRFSLSEENISIRGVIELIEEQSEFRFFYEEEKLNVNEKLDLNIENSTINDVLNELFKQKGVEYKIMDNNFIVLKSVKSISGLLQQKTVSGKVTDSTDAPLPGVTVIVKGTTNGTITNFDGEYNLTNVPVNGTIRFSFIGMKSQEIVVADKTTIDIVMQDDAIGIEEVVAVGYGTVKKRDLTGSVGSLDNEMIVERGSTSPMEAMQGQIAGVQINSSNGRIGGGFDITIRGINTLSDSNSPLYVVDGIPTDNIDFLNPQDISRIDILKDASSTAIYGSRGTNGVVLVTTKQAGESDGTFSIGYSGYYGVKAVARLPKMMSGEKWWEYRKDARIAGFNDLMNISEEDLLDAAGATPWLNERISRGQYTDWYDEVLKNGSQENHHISISGQSKNKMSYVIGLGYQKEEGLIEKESIDKYSIKGNILHEINEKWSAGTNLNFIFIEQQSGSDIAMQEAFRLPPVATPRDDNGNLILQPGTYNSPSGEELLDMTSTWNPLLQIANSNDDTRMYNVLGNMFLEFKPVIDLSLKSTMSFGAIFSRQGKYWGKLTKEWNDNGKQPLAAINKNENLNYTWDNQVNYSKSFEDHSLNLMGLVSLYYTRSEFSSIDVKNLPFESGIYNLGSAGTINSVGSNFIKATMLSYVLRANYSFNSKYLVTLSNRWDGSSKLSEGNKWNAFPSGALGWRVSEESFIQDIESISNLKLRVSYGFTGNNAVSPYQTISYADKLVYYDFFGNTANGFRPAQIANNILTWEKTRELNLGLDFGIFDQRISGSVDFYDKLSKELLMEQKLPAESGWASMQANVGSVSNKGIELMLNTINIDKKDLKWETTFTFSKNVNKIVEIYGGKNDDIGNNWFIDEPVAVHYNYKYDGVWQADEAEEAAFYGFKEGNAKVVDYGEKGYSADEDRVILGSPLPNWIGSFSTYLKYKNFDFSANLFTNQGVLVFSHFHDNFADVRSRGRQKLDVNYYVPQNNITAPNGPKVSNEYPQPRNEGSFWTADNVAFYHDASFVKVKNITLGYTLGKSALNAMHVKSCRIYANILNPFVFTSYEGYDPEWGGARLSDGGVASVTYQFGVNLQF